MHTFHKQYVLIHFFKSKTHIFKPLFETQLFLLLLASFSVKDFFFILHALTDRTVADGYSPVLKLHTTQYSYKLHLLQSKNKKKSHFPSMSCHKTHNKLVHLFHNIHFFYLQSCSQNFLKKNIKNF